MWTTCLESPVGSDVETLHAIQHACRLTLTIADTAGLDLHPWSGPLLLRTSEPLGLGYEERGGVIAPAKFRKGVSTFLVPAGSVWAMCTDDRYFVEPNPLRVQAVDEEQSVRVRPSSRFRIELPDGEDPEIVFGPAGGAFVQRVGGSERQFCRLVRSPDGCEIRLPEPGDYTVQLTRPVGLAPVPPVELSVREASEVGLPVDLKRR
jgi:hypothetical protein